MYNFETASEKDVSEIFSCYLDRAKWFADNNIEHWTEEYLREYCSEESIANHVQSKEFFVIRFDGKIVAGCVLKTDQGERELWKDEKGDSGFIEYLFSNQKGAGQILLGELKKLCINRGLKFLKLDCRNHNEKLKDYYLSNGFEHVGTIPHPVYEDMHSALMRFDLKNTLASDLVDFTSNIDSGQEFNRDTLHLFCSPLFLQAMYMLYDKNIQTISCGSGKERGILPGITCNFDTLSSENKELVKHLVISPGQFRIGAPIGNDTTFAEFEANIMKIAKGLKKQ